jgi:hypothetical protein
MTSYTARALSTDRLQKIIHQFAHTFVVGDVLYFNGTIYALAQATNISLSETVGIVSFVLDANNFVLTQAGYVSNIVAAYAPLLPGSLYYLDVNPGQLNILAPTSVGDVTVPLLIADTPTSGWYFNNAGRVIESGNLVWQTITANQTLVVNNGYFCNGALQLQLLLPAVSSIGDEIRVVSLNGFGFSINQAGDNVTGQQMQFLGGSTTIGAAGSAATVTSGDVVDIVCDIAGVHWVNTIISGPSLLIT